MSCSQQAPSIRHLLTSNDLPTAADLPGVWRGIGDLEIRISEVKATALYWMSQLRDLEDQLKIHNGILSVTRRIPAEIWGQIFLAYPFDMSTSPPALTQFGRQDLVQLMLVCKGWRYVALYHAHRLWSTVQVEADEASRLSYSKAVTWLTRAGNVPRTLAIRLDRRIQCPGLCAPQLADSPPIRPCILSKSLSLGKLLSVGPPLHILGIETLHRRCMANFVSTLPRPFPGCKLQPSLRTLYLTVRFAEENSGYQFLSHFPSITNIYLAGQRGIDSLNTPLTAGYLERLTFLSFGRTGWNGGTLHILSRCQNLQELSIFLPSVLGFYSTLYTAYLPKVTVLRVKVEVGLRAEGSFILNHLHFPALATIDITDARDPSSALSWKNFFQKHPSVKTFQCRDTDGAFLEAAFDHLPFLARLVVCGDSALTRLTQNFTTSRVAQRPRFMASLEQLELLKVGQPFELEDLYEFLLSRAEGHRSAGVALMKEFRVEFLSRAQGASCYGKVEKLLRGSLKIVALRKTGMRVTITSYLED
ncbi:hypothetical protein FA13DRAFT_1725813 [Coprinellus micaceus]|uniref:Uncharacterized protein n=2 Tax=Coprinellus micaceus TaxID=71717 RepID=A0A4Y7TX78_COPMI|nr:hypothetical protein FA13DRAFT_1725813 [Coprinellus micaceus]